MLEESSMLTRAIIRNEREEGALSEEKRRAWVCASQTKGERIALTAQLLPGIYGAKTLDKLYELFGPKTFLFLAKETFNLAPNNI
jgi:hypothetical protein